MARFGVEGVSERIRMAFAKPVQTDQLVEMLADFHEHHVNTHLFWIAGAPFETDSDMGEFVRLWERLAKTIQWGICRMKFTTFNIIPPAPLCRFLPGNSYEARYTRFLKDWRPKNAASRHIIVIPFRKNASRVGDVAEMLGIDEKVAAALCSKPETVDLAPTAADFRRLQGELVRWPQPPEARWRAAEVYRSRMGG